MTRINVIIPNDLADQHLMAEYRELPMVAKSLSRSINSKNGLVLGSAKYTLGTGHVRFFYNKGKFLERRYNAICEELLNRNYNLSNDRNLYFDIFKDNNLFFDWFPDEYALNVNANRIFQKLESKRDWYKYYGQPITDNTNLFNPKIFK